MGREREMEALSHAAEQAKSGHGQIVAAMAEPGVGKSRLYFEFKATYQSGWMVLETFSVSHGKARAYLPVIDLLHSISKSRTKMMSGRVARRLPDESSSSIGPRRYAAVSVMPAGNRGRRRPTRADGRAD